MAIVNIPERICPHCNGTMWLVTKSTSSKGNRYTCSLKNREKVAAWKEKNPEKYIEGRKKVSLDMKLYRKDNTLPRKRKTFKNHLPEEELKEICLKVKSDTTLTKVCKLCNEEKQLQAFYFQIRKTGKVYSKPRCRLCTSRDYKERNREKINEKARNNYNLKIEEQREKHRIWATGWRKRNPEKIKIKSITSWEYVKADPTRLEKKNKLNSIYSKKNRENLSDGYVVARIIGRHGRGILYKKDIPQDLIDLKRTELLLKRQIA